ncbi:MAG: hypothetical protein M3322_12035 [Actinomycetota bacterium]|nr:hypothetical protein [Actinomycetota bacterium]
MPDLPTGTVTFLFTDLEGSTRLLAELGDRYAEALAEHRRLLREAFRRHGGGEERFENSRRNGAAMTLDGAIEYGLSSVH